MNLSSFRGWRMGALAVMLLLTYAFAFQGSRGLWSPDEGRYTEAAMQMLRTGDWIHPRLHHEHLHYTKPPMTYWAIASSVRSFGHSEWAVRLPYALAFFGTTLLCFGLGRRLVPDRPWLPALVYATALLPYLAANAVTTDTLLAFATTLYGYAFVAARATPERVARWRLVMLLWLAAALAFMTKGPPGLLPLAGLFVFAFSERRTRPLGHYVHPVALLAFVVLAFAWFGKVVADRPEVMRYFLVEEVVNRVASDSVHRNGQWYGWITVYLPTLLLGTLPWTWPLLRECAAAVRAPGAARRALAANPEARLLACWILLPLLVFCVARSRLPLYLVPLFVPLSLAAARLLPAALRPWQLGGIAAWVLLLVLGRGVTSQLSRPEDDRALARSIAALGLAQIDEVVFIDAAPRYGLGFYLGAEVERITLDERPTVDSFTERMKPEMDDHEGCRLLLGEPREAALLDQAIAALKLTAHKLTPVGPYESYVVDEDPCRQAPGASP